MASSIVNDSKRTVILIALVPILIIGCVFLDGAWRIVSVVALLLLVAALSATVGAEVKKQRDAKNLT